MEKTKLEIKKEFSQTFLKDMFYTYVNGHVVGCDYSLDDAIEKIKGIKNAMAQAEPVKVVYEEVF